MPKVLGLTDFIDNCVKFNTNLTKLSFLQEQLAMKKARMEEQISKLQMLRERTARFSRVEMALLKNQDLKVAHGDMHFNLIQCDKFQEEKKD